MEDLQKECCSGNRRKCCGHWPIAVAVIIVMLSLATWLGLKARNTAREYTFIGVPIERNTISVTGEGRATAKPDIARIELGTVIEKLKVADAQQENTRIMNALNEKLVGFGMKPEDIQTSSYNINPMYDWNDGKQKLRGYQVQQGLRLKIRDLEKVDDIIGAAGTLGVNQVGGIEFTVDKPEELRRIAREEAMENAKQKAKDLARITEIKLRRVISFNEGGVSEPIYNRAYAKDMAYATGGEMAPTPTIQAGSTEIVINATVVYEIE